MDTPHSSTLPTPQHTESQPSPPHSQTPARTRTPSPTPVASTLATINVMSPVRGHRDLILDSTPVEWKGSQPSQNLYNTQATPVPPTSQDFVTDGRGLVQYSFEDPMEQDMLSIEE